MGMFDNPAAFVPFFDDTIAYKGVRTGSSVRTSLSACVLDAGFDEVFAEDGSTESRIRKITVYVEKTAPGWKEAGLVPQVGDEISLESGVNFAVTNVGILDKSIYTLEARAK